MIKEVGTIGFWITALITAGLGLRLIRDFMEAYWDPEIGMKEAFRKSRRRIFATVVALLSTSLVALFKRYYF